MTHDKLPDEPQVLGRFNFLSFKKDLFDVLFYPFEGSATVIIARNLTYDEMQELRTGLNQELDETQRDINTR